MAARSEHLIKRIDPAAERQLRRKNADTQQASTARKQRYETTTVSRSRGTSTFFNGAAQMEEPKRFSSTTTEAQGADAVQEDRDGVVLNWGGKRTEVDRIVLTFQRIEGVNESRATREAVKRAFFRDLKSDVEQ